MITSRLSKDFTHIFEDNFKTKKKLIIKFANVRYFLIIDCERRYAFLCSVILQSIEATFLTNITYAFASINAFYLLALPIFIVNI